MNTVNKTSRILGLAFLLQFITSFGSAMFLRATWYVPGNMSETLIKIASNPSTLRVNILFDVLTALGVIFLGAMLFITLRKQNEKMALTALGFYILEAALLATSRMATFALLGLSQAYAVAGHADMTVLGQIAFDAMDFVGSDLHMLAFIPGAVMFYYLLDRARIIPRVLSLWGLIAALPFVIGAPLAVLGYEIPMALYLPYVPFEFVIGAWIVVKGIQEEPPRAAFAQPAFGGIA